jgi:hypothetical protein
MSTKIKTSLFLSARRTLDLLRAVLTPELKPAGLNLDALEGGHESLIRSLPAWVKRFGFLAGAGQYCLWCEPKARPRQTFPSQMIFEIPRGRYLIDILDTATRTWMSRESAEGGPLVASLPYTGNPLLIWIRVLDLQLG